VPPFVPLFWGAQLEFLYTLGGKVVENRLWLTHRQGPPDSTRLLDAANGAAAWCIDSLLPLLSSDLILAAVVVTDWTVENGPFEVAPITPLPGGDPSPAHSANVSYRIRFSNQFFRIGYYNANFVPGVPVDKVATNTIDHDWAQAVQFAYALLHDAVGVWGPFPAWSWVITSRQLNGAWRDEQAFTTAFTTFIPTLTVAPRRRRLPS